MNAHRQPTTRLVLLSAIGVILLVAAHGVVLHFAARHLALPISILSGAMLLVAIMHLKARRK